MRITFLALFILVVVTMDAKAQDSNFTLHGRYFLHFAETTAFPLDDTGFEDGLNRVLDHRLRIKPVFQINGNLSVISSFDVLAGQLAFDTTETGQEALVLPRNRLSFYATSIPRELYVRWDSGAGRLQIGQMASSWGLGMVSNDGEDRDDDFYDTRLGDLVERAMFITRPFEPVADNDFTRSFYLLVAGDLVFRDANARLLDGDLAGQGILALFYRTEETFAGIYGAFREQKYSEGDRLRVGVVDVYGRHELSLDWGTLELAAETAMMIGHTDAASFERARDGLDILSWGALGRIVLDAPSVGLRPGVDFGVAWGDDDSQDGVSHAFSFNPDCRMGMILFEEVLGRMSARATDRVSDPALVQTPIKGYKLAATNGAITNAVFVYPKIRWWPIPGYSRWRDLELRLAFLWARGVTPVGDPFNTARNGGYPAGYRVNPALLGGRSWNGKTLGYEVDGGLSYKVPLGEETSLHLGVQAGIFIAQEALDDASGAALDTIFKVRALADLVW